MKEYFSLITEEISWYFHTHENAGPVLFWLVVLVAIAILGHSCGGGGGRYTADVWD